MAYDPKWDAQSWFDGAFRYDALRLTQRFLLENVSQNGELFIGEGRSKLLSKVSLLALTCGAGKTVLMLAYLFAICEQVNRRQKRAPRPVKVLWFGYQVQICRQIKKDILDDITRHRLVMTLPDITICDQSGDLDRGPGQHHIVISCPNALWEGTNQRRSDAEIETLLSQYDVIIWDECDFARNQIDRLVRLSPHALKFGLTAAPIDADGSFIRNYFVLAASASHATVFSNDHCLAPMLPWSSALQRGYVREVRHHGFGRLVAAVEQVQEDGTHGEKHSLPGTQSAIRQAIEDSISHEQRMRQLWPSLWFSPHIFVVCNTRSEAFELWEQTARDIQLLGLSADDGWYPSIMVSNSTNKEKQIFERNRPKNELNLFHKNPELKHPFMLALENNGRCTSGSSRIIFVVDIAIRALNHWALKYVVDVKRSGSWSEQLQTIGRMSRLPSHLTGMRGDPQFDEFCHPRWYFPYPGENSRISNAARDAWEFILQMDARLENSGLPTWPDLLENRKVEETVEPPDPNAPFTMMDRLQIDNELGALQEHGKQISPEDVARIVAELPDPQAPGRTECAREHIRRVLTDRDYRRRIIEPSFDIIRPISREAPKDAAEYTIDELSDFILRDDDFDNDIIDELGTNATIRKVVAQAKRKQDKQYYRTPIKIRQLIEANEKPGVLTDIRNSIVGDLIKSGFDYRAIIGPVSQAVYAAAAIMCGMVDENGTPDENCTRNEGPLDRPSYHYQFSIPSVQKKLKQIAMGKLIVRGVVGPAQNIYGDPQTGVSNVA
jgi:hypothetical protein